MADTPCPNCSLNIYKAEQETARAKTALDRVHVAETERDTARAEAATARAKPPDVPSLMSLIAHCESGECADHTKEWNDVKAKVIEKIPDDYIKTRATALGMVDKPAASKTIKVAVG